MRSTKRPPFTLPYRCIEGWTRSSSVVLAGIRHELESPTFEYGSDGVLRISNRGLLAVRILFTSQALTNDSAEN